MVERMFDQVGGAKADMRRKCLIRVNHAEPAIADHNEIGQRVERAFKLAPRSQQLLEQDDVFNDR
jgi:hypothetical protein